ncbi:hypothetical protein RE6C_01570 [Rhodopirellula europaea 6C]|uniref:Uncharacterized protein n=1 Tax=Rhodopirellula europaea 6C TaxID=1263867 RepID=M2B7K2_9BACT|nr:hypothetical protein RE6C_01570 [Rhodopirellula europaea 6C]
MKASDDKVAFERVFPDSTRHRNSNVGSSLVIATIHELPRNFIRGGLSLR